MVLRDPNTLDLAQQKLRVADDLLVWPARQQGELVYRIEIPKLHRFFQVGYEEYVLISLLDGNTTLPQACGLAAAKLGSRAPTAMQAGTIARWLLRSELAYLESDGPPQRRLRGAADASTEGPAQWLARWNPFWIKLPLPNGHRWMHRIAKLLSVLFSGPAIVAGVLAIVVAAVVLASKWNEFALSSAHVFHTDNWLWLLASWTLLKLLHETGHAIACDRQGGQVREAGLVLVLFAPLAYVDVTSCWRMNSRYARILVALAGMYIEVAIAAIAVLLWAFVVDAPHAKFLLYNLIVTAGLSTLLFNANVLMRFDGYFILADLIEVPNLYGEASASVGRLAQRIVIGEQSDRGPLRGWRRHFVVAYGIAALIWRAVICVSLAIASSVMFAGAGIVIAIIGIGLWMAPPVTRLRRIAADLRVRCPDRLTRAIVVSTLLMAALVGLVFWMPIPTSMTVPAVCQYQPEAIVRSRASGFITAIHVADGSQARQGDLLVELENRELVNRFDQLEIKWKQNKIRLRTAIETHNASTRLVLEEKQKSLVEQMEQINRQISGLRILAPRSGRVVAKDLATKVGTYVAEGDSLLAVATDAEKQVVAMIAQDRVQNIRPLVGADIRIRTADFTSRQGRLDRIEPRATDRLTDLALAATQGGPLAVRNDPDGEHGSESLRLLEPHFRARIELSPIDAASIPAGMRIQACFGFSTDSLAKRIAAAVRRLWHSSVDGSRSTQPVDG